MNGQDRGNIDLADFFWRSFVYMAREGTISGRKHIAVAIENEVLDESTNIRYKKLLENEQKIMLFTFGGDRQRFQWDRLLMRGLRETRSGKFQKAEEMLPGMISMDAAQDDFFDEWSRLARRVHLAYKVASAGCFTYTGESRQDGPVDLENRVEDKVNYCKSVKENPVLFERLTWLEHRRWNAFMRTQGFRRPPHLTDLLRKLEKGTDIGTDPETLKTYAYKYIPARLHPNLVESIHGIRESQPDLLDAASDMRDYVDTLLGNPKTGDIKVYDRPDGQNGPTVSYEELYRYCEILESRKNREELTQLPRLHRIMEMMKENHPDLHRYEDQREPGRYYVGSLLELELD